MVTSTAMVTSLEQLEPGAVTDAQVVAAAIQAALQSDTPPRSPRRGRRAPAADGEQLF